MFDPVETTPDVKAGPRQLALAIGGLVSVAVAAAMILLLVFGVMPWPWWILAVVLAIPVPLLLHLLFKRSLEPTGK